MFKGKEIGKSVRLTPIFPEATEKDYIEIQGGKPDVYKDGELTVIEHNYPKGKGIIVRSHIDHGTINLKTSTGTKEFRTDLLKQFHGDPCERQSKICGW